MIAIVKDYKNYVNKLPEIIADTYYKADYFANGLDLKLPTYYRKLREKSFTLEEVEALTKLLYPKECYKQELLESLEDSRKEIKEGKSMTNEEMKQMMREKIESYQ